MTMQLYSYAPIESILRFLSGLTENISVKLSV